MALVMLPVTVMCVLIGSILVSHWSLAERAHGVDDGVAGVSALVDLHAALHKQQAAEEFDVRFAQFGVTRDVAKAFIGFDWGTEVAAARVDATRAATALGPASPVSAESLPALYTAIDAGAITPAIAAERLGSLAGTTADAVTRELDRLQAEVREIPLLKALESVRTASNLVNVTTPQVIDLSAIWFPSPGDTPQATAVVQARFGAESADYATAIARLRSLGVEGVVTGLVAIDGNPQVQAFDQAVAASLRGEPVTANGAALDTVKVAAAFRGHLVLEGLLGGIVTTARALSAAGIPGSIGRP